MKLLTIILLTITTCAMAQTTWYEIPSGSDKKLNTISFGSSSVGYIGGNDSTLLKTTDGGQSWSEMSFTGVDFYMNAEHIVNLKFTNENIGFMTIGPYTGTYKTVDGGSTWSEVSTPGDLCYNQGLYLWDENNGIIAGAGCFQGELISKMDNGNVAHATISSMTFDPSSYIKDVDFLDNNIGIAVSHKRFYRTTDGGLNWDTITSGIQYELTSVSVVNDTLIYAGYIDTNSNGFGVLISKDDGLTWSMDLSSATFYYPDYNDVHHTSSNYIYLGGKTSFQEKGIMFENKGNGWNFTEVDHPINAIENYDDIVFSVGDSGIIITNFEPTLLSNEPIQNNISNINLYPNPAQGEINISGIDDLKNPTLIIRDIQGKLVKLIKTKKSRILISDIPTGLYILEIQSQSNHYTKKFIKK